MLRFCQARASAVATRWLSKQAKSLKPKSFSTQAPKEVVSQAMNTTSKETFGKTTSKAAGASVSRWVAAATASASAIGGAFYMNGFFGNYVGGKTTQLSPAPWVDTTHLPIEQHKLVFAPHVPPPITRRHPVRLMVDIPVEVKVSPIDEIHDYEFWTFGGQVPGPFIRARVGDVLDLRMTNMDESGMLHNMDFHAVLGPGGGAPVTTAEKFETSHAEFRLTKAGLFVYHCAVDPVSVHVTNGMYGMILVEPEDGLPPVDNEFYVMQGEMYCESDPAEGTNTLEINLYKEEREHPTHVVFNGRTDSLRGERMLKVKNTDITRIFFGNGGPNLTSSFHIIGAIFDRVYRDADLISPPARNLQTTSVPPGGATVVEFETPVPGTLALVDHAIGRVGKGCVGFLQVIGDDLRHDIYYSDTGPVPCPACKTHPPVDPALVALAKKLKADEKK